MFATIRPLARVLSTVALLTLGFPALAAERAEIPTWPHDLSPAGMRAVYSQTRDPQLKEQVGQFLPEATLEEVRRFIGETRQLGLASRSGMVTLAGPPNVRANNPAGDRIGETQSEISVAVNGDTVVVGWNDSQGFLGAPITLSSFGYSTNGGATFTDGGNVPLALPTDQAFGDTGLDTDERGNWYLNSIYTRAAGAPGPTAQQNIGVHHGRFNGAGVLVWDPPAMAAIGTSATGNLDKCLLACDRVTGNVYTAYTRFTAVSQIEIVRSTTLGVTWDPPVVLDATSIPTASKQGARPFCGPGGEVYVVWEKGANSIFCPDGLGNVASFSAQIAFTRSLDFGLTYSPFTIIGSPVTGFLASGPGDLRERANEFPDIGVDRSGGLKNGNIYVTYHTAAPWTTNTAAGPVKIETGVINNNPGTPDLFVIGDDVTGAITPAGDLDYWQFDAVQGQNLMIDLLPQGFVCGVSGTTRQMRMRLFATQSPYPNPTGFPDSMLAASFIGSFENRIVWTAPKTGSYLIRLQISGGTTTGTYTLRVRPLTFGPAVARDARDVVVVRSTDQGSTWSGEQLVNDDPAGLENRRPFIAVDGLGHVHNFWHDSRIPGLGSNAALTSIFGSTSRDGGATWTPNYEVTDELSFFSFNTLAVPNLGDYNTAAGYGGVTHAAWTDQRLSTGDVRTPGTNTYTAGLGPEAYTTRVIFSNDIICPPDSTLSAKGVVSLLYRIRNTGTIPDSYSYSVTDNNGWITPAAGATGPVPPGGTFDIKVTATGDADCNPGTDVITFSVGAIGDQSPPRTCTTTLTCTPVDISKTLVSDRNPSVCGEKVNLTATLSQLDATGTVNFFDGLDPIGSAPVINGVANLSITTLAPGPHSITAVYKGDGGHLPETSNPVDQVVDPIPTTTTLTSEPNPSGCQQDVTIVATVSPDPGGGTVNFFSDGKQIGSAPVLGGGTASITLSGLSVGSHALTATYKGDACNAPSTSAPVKHDVVPNPMAVALSSDMNPSSCSVKVTLRAKVIEPAPPGLVHRGSGPVLLAPPPPTGTVNFFDNGNPIGSVPLGPDSTAVLSVTNFTVGEHSLTATYKGDTCYALAVSDKLVQLVDPFLTTTTLASSPNPSTCGEKVTITATVDPPTATGTVNFADGLNPIGSAPVVNGVATLSVTTFTAGNHSITAEYSGDACYAASLADKINQLVNSASTTTTLATSPNPSSCGEKVTLTARVAPTGATGDVNFFDGPNHIGVASLVNGVATLSVTAFTVGSHPLTARYKGDECYSPSASNTVDQVVNPAATTTTLTTDPNPSRCGDKVTLTATVGPSTATGDVNFFDGPNPIGTAPLVNGVATLSVTTFTAGTHLLAARYKGDACYAPSATNTVVNQVVGSAPTATTVSSTPNPSACAEKVTITAAVTPAAATGEVNFFDGPNAIGAGTLVNGVATLSITTLAVGTHSITAVYKGDACYAPSTSNKIEQVVRPVITVTTLTSDDLKSECGRKVTLTATVTPATATGLVNFFDGPTPIGSVPLVNGVATLSISTLAVGAHPIIAVYKGDGCFGPSAAGPIQQVVNQVVTTLTLTSDPSPSTCRDDKVTVTATVSPGTATGTVNFFDAGVPIGSVQLVNGVAVLSVTTFMNGTHPLTAVYKGDACHATSTGSHEHVRDCPVATLLTLFQAEPVTGAVELRWQYGEPGLFVETRIDRATSPAGPWSAVNAELRQDGDVQVAVDRSVTAGGSYWYRLVARPASGAPVVFGPIAAAAGVSIEKFELASIWPNPTKGMTRVDFTVAKQSAIRLSIVDVQGREVAVLAEGSHRPGRYQAVWTGETARGLAPVGLYFVRYQIPGKVLTGRIALTR